MVTIVPQRHWETIARRWSHVGSPLRPRPEDADGFAALLDLPSRAPLRVLILGVTPELFHLPWPAGSTVESADRSPEMIRAIWPGPEGSAHHTEWLEMPFAPESFDCVLCDGGLHLLEGVATQRALSSAIGRILRKGGQFAVRLFALPEQAEDPWHVFADLRTGGIANFHIFKLRTAMALQPSFETGILLHQVHERIIEEFGSLEAIRQASGWPTEEVGTLSSYHQSKNRYHFATEAQSVEVLSSGGSLLFERRIENRYPLGERCPILSFRKA